MTCKMKAQTGRFQWIHFFIEPVIFLHTFGVFISYFVLQVFALDRACRVNLGFPGWLAFALELSIHLMRSWLMSLCWRLAMAYEWRRGTFHPFHLFINPFSDAVCDAMASRDKNSSVFDNSTLTNQTYDEIDSQIQKEEQSIFQWKYIIGRVFSNKNKLKEGTLW